MEFAIIEITENAVFNYFFSFNVYMLFVLLPIVAILNLIKKV
jgi:hypothetical protein